MKIIVIGIMILVTGFYSNAEELLTISAKEKGISEFDFEVKEVTRNNNSSILKVVKFQDRSAAASRWMMCAYSEIAQKRGFSFWAALYDDNSGDEVIVVFPSSKSLEDPAFHDIQVKHFKPQIMPVKVFKKFCGLSDV